MSDNIMGGDEVIALIDRIECGRIKWKVGAVAVPSDTGVMLQGIFTTNGVEHHGRKWYISPYATRSEVVQTLFKAALTIAEHELRESFLYNGRAIFGPHYDIEALYRLADGKHLEVRNGS